MDDKLIEFGKEKENDNVSNKKSLNIVEEKIDSSISKDLEEENTGIDNNIEEEDKIQISFSKGLMLFTKLSLGISIMSISHLYLNISLVFGVFLLICFCICNWWTVNLLAYLCNKNQVYEYSILVKIILGSKAEKIYNIVLILSSTLTIIAYINIAYDLIANTAFDFVYSNKENYPEYNENLDLFLSIGPFSSFLLRSLIIYGLMIILLIPIGLKRDMASLAPIAFIGSMAILYILLLLIIQTPKYFEEAKANQKASDIINWINVKKSFTSKLLFFSSSATIVFSLDVQFALLEIYGSLKEKSYTNMKKLNKYGFSLICLIIGIISICGFLTSPYKSYELCILRQKIGNSDYFMTIGKILVIFNMICDIAINYHMLKLSFFEILLSTSKYSKKQNFFFTVLSYIILITIAVFYKAITFYLAIGGGFASTTYCFILPCLMYLKDQEFDIKKTKNITTIIICTLLALIGVTGGIISFTNEFNKKA